MICSILEKICANRFLADPDVLRAFFGGKSSQFSFPAARDSCSRRISKLSPHQSREPINLTNSPLGEGVFLTEHRWIDGFKSAKQVLGSNGTIMERYRQPNYISAVLV